MAHPFKRPEDWSKIRCRILVRDSFECQFPIDDHGTICGRTYNDISKLHIHHKIPVEKGGPHEDWNLITVCEEHHEQIHPFMKRIR